MEQWLRQFNVREQMALLACAVALALYLLYVAIWNPVQTMRADMSQQNSRISESLQRVQGLAGELQRLRSSGAPSRASNLNQVINSSTAKQGIAPTRIQPSASGDIQIRFEDVQFAGLLRWMHQLEFEEGLAIREVSINQGARGGLVNASIRVGKS
ncbi:type II secretion system protein GspM [Candidatus Litorirhabdus singularis]|uniref:type II secretion system protein GspM n=1 Tax=Candidatus Litorirhabdus singularis TaxID=2518993 RepID=UPI00242C40CE|nr:type II secretion system protein GspM [Candidatus Litorirhabdus singularis]